MIVSNLVAGKGVEESVEIHRREVEERIWFGPQRRPIRAGF
jgi:hypothetical protein